MTSKHTPGPWRSIPTGMVPNEWNIIHEWMSADGCPVRGHVARAYGNDEANARLIAAAPETAAERDSLKAINAELLEALLNNLSLVKLKFGNTDKTGNAVIEQAEAIIAKAKESAS